MFAALPRLTSQIGSCFSLLTSCQLKGIQEDLLRFSWCKWSKRVESSVKMWPTFEANRFLISAASLRLQRDGGDLHHCSAWCRWTRWPSFSFKGEFSPDSFSHQILNWGHLFFLLNVSAGYQETKHKEFRVSQPVEIDEAVEARQVLQFSMLAR